MGSERHSGVAVSMIKMASFTMPFIQVFLAEDRAGKSNIYVLGLKFLQNQPINILCLTA